MTARDVPRTPQTAEPGGAVALGAGPNEGVVRDLSRRRGEPEWLLRLRLRGVEGFRSEDLPPWATFLRDIDFDEMVEPETVDDDGRSRPPAAVTPGLTALAASEDAYRVIRKDLESRGIRFYSLSSAVRRIPDRIKEHLASVVPPDDPFAALNAALWTEGSFVYVPPGTSASVPLQAEIREDYSGVEPFERNLLVADRGSEVTYIEGCTAPVYTPERLHLSAIEIVALPDSHSRYIALQNFSKEVDNLVTKRAQVHAGASIEWVDVNLGSRRTKKVPRADLIGPGASAEFIGFTLAGHGQSEEVGAEMVHRAPRTRSRIVNQAVVLKGGRSALHSGVRVVLGATQVASSVEWSSLMLDSDSRVETIPGIEVDEADAEIAQEGKVRKVGEEMLFYMASRGVTEEEATRMVVLGVATAATRRIPVEYAVEVDRLIELELGGGIG